MSYTVAIKVELNGIPHTWITLTDASGNSISYGYGASEDANIGDKRWPIDEGYVSRDDGTGQEVAGNEADILAGNGWSETYEITPEQYQSMVNRAEAIKSDPGTYLGVGNNCTDFVRDVLQTGDVPHPLGRGPHPISLIPARERTDALANNISENTIWLSNFMDGGLSIEEFEDLFNSAASTYISPIVLDLDGDGVETIGVTAGAYFDHDGNGFAEQTGWAGADDGLLVWDRNGDGRINDGKELFGSETILADGTKAANGYAALAELDTNADGRVDANDAAFASLKVWKDLDGDGYSSAGELFALADVGVASLNTASASSTYIDPNGNQHKLTGSFTKTDGSVGSTADVWFQTDTLYTIQEDYLPVTADIAALPDLRGYGNVYDLQQAMVRDSTGSLKALIEQFVAESSPGNRNQLLEQILYKWTGADTIDPASRGAFFDAQKLVVMEKFYGRGYVGSNGSPNPGCNVVSLLDASYSGLSEMLYAQLMAQTHLKGLYDTITYSWDTATQSIQGDLSWVLSALQLQLAADPDAGRFALAEFARSVKGLAAQSTLGFTAFRDAFAAQDPLLGTIIDNASGATIYGTAGNDTYTAGNANDLAFAGDGNDSITDAGGTNVVYAGTGNDTIAINGPGANMVYGGDGNDHVEIHYDSDNTLAGGAGDDYLMVWRVGGGSPIHHNTFTGGTGSDYLLGGASTDTYVFNRGDGSDTVNDYDWNVQGATDTIAFGAGIAVTDLVVRRTGNDLLIRVTDPGNPAATDQINIQYRFSDPSHHRVEQFTFADGTVWDIAQIHAHATAGTASDDSLTGWDGENLTYTGLSGNDTITAYGGNDTIYGDDGNDIISDTGGNNTVDGGAGNDTVNLNGAGTNTVHAGDGNDHVEVIWNTDNTLDGGTGDDYLMVWRVGGGSPISQNTFTGGLGNDSLLGGASTDTYIFNRGDGQDTVNDYDWNVQGATDTVAFGAGIGQSDLVVSRSGDHLLVRINDPNNPSATDQITVQWWYADPSHHRVERFDFADGSSLTAADMEALTLVVSGTEGADTLYGYAGNDTIRGYGGNDTISDSGGNNVIDGGAGDDTLSAADGNDTLIGGAGADRITDTGGTNVVNAGDGNDYVEIKWNTNNTLDGGAGDDYMLIWRVGDGSPIYHNTFTGGAGNDYLLSGASTDTYVFNPGDGQDTVNDYDWNVQGANDTIAFGTGINPLDLVLSRNGDHLKLSVHNSTDSVNVQWWYADPSHHHVETVQAGNGSTLVDTQVEQLIQAMATFGAQNGGISWDQAIDQRPDDVQAILAANWMPAG